MKKKIYIATPAYNSVVHAEYCFSLFNTIRHLDSYQIDSIVSIKMSGSLLTFERNIILSDFLSTDATHLMLIDSDLGWKFESVKKLLDYDEDFVAGVYPCRVHKEFLVHIKYDEKKRLIQKGDLIEATAVPAGFMLISRNLIEKMIDFFPDLKFIGDGADTCIRHALFNTIVKDNKFWGEDFTFCMRASEAGFKIYVDPYLSFNHAGIIGTLSDALIQNGSFECKSALHQNP